jgi:hypothetical protein
VNSTQENTKKIILDSIVYIIENNNNPDILEDDAVTLKDSRAKAVHMYNRIRDAGWIYEEEIKNNDILVCFDKKAMKVLDILKDIVSGSRLEYTGYLNTIYYHAEALKNFKNIESIEQMDKGTKDFISNLKGLKADIFAYYKELLKGVKSSEVANTILNELKKYKTNFFDTSFINLKTYDNLHKFKNSILKIIEYIEDTPSFTNELTTKRINDEFKTTDEARKYIFDTLDYIKISLNSVSKLITSIDDKNNNYLQAAINKLMFYIDSSDDFNGIYNQLIRFAINSATDFTKDYKFNLYVTKMLNNSSLYTARDINRTKGNIEPIRESHVDKVLVDKKLKDILLNAEFSYNNITKYALKLLEGRSEIYASEMPFNNTRDFAKTILILLYSATPECKYIILKTSNKIFIKGITFCDFILKRGNL